MLQERRHDMRTEVVEGRDDRLKARAREIQRVEFVPEERRLREAIGTQPEPESQTSEQESRSQAASWSPTISIDHCSPR